MIEHDIFPMPEDYGSWAYMMQCIKGPEPRNARGALLDVKQPLIRRVQFDGHIPGMVEPGLVKVQMMGCAPAGYKLRVREHGVCPQQSTLLVSPEESRMTGEPFTLGVLATKYRVSPLAPMISERELNQPDGYGVSPILEREMLPLERVQFCNFLFAIAARTPIHTPVGQPYASSHFDLA